MKSKKLRFEIESLRGKDSLDNFEFIMLYTELEKYIEAVCKERDELKTKLEQADYGNAAVEFCKQRDEIKVKAEILVTEIKHAMEYLEACEYNKEPWKPHEPEYQMYASFEQALSEWNKK